MRFTISRKILASFGLVVLLVAIAGLYQLGILRAVRDINHQIVENDIEILGKTHTVELLQGRAWLVSEQLRAGHFLAALGIPSTAQRIDGDDWREAADKVTRTLEEVQAQAQRLLAEDGDQARAAMLRQIQRDSAQAQETYAQVGREMGNQIARLAAGDFRGAEDIDARLAGLRGRLVQQLGQLRASADTFVAESNAGTEEAYRHAQVSLLIGVLVVVVIGSIATWFLQRSITRPIAEFARFVTQIGAGDLTRQIRLSGGDEVSALGHDLNRMVEGLREVAGQTRSVADNLNSATVQIRASTQQQAASVEEQLASIQETSATLDEITQSGAQMSRRAQDIAAGSEETLQASGNGLRAVERTTEVMDAIREQAESVAENIVTLSEKTQAVGDIIATVNDISERSHILALNAAIEAAAAGEHGRSFAVVASEMKNLADQAKGATLQVRAILGEIQRGISTSVMLTEEAVKRVASGKEQTDASQHAINDLTDTIQESSETFQQIVAAINQQHIGLEQVMIALRNIRQASTQTADGTRQLDGAAANLNALATQLSHSVNRYRL